MKAKKPPVCLTIAGLDPSGGAGIVADVKTFSAFGCFAAAAVSSVTYQNTTGVFGSTHQTADSVRKQVEAVLDDHDIAALKTGMLPTGDIVEEVAAIIIERGLKNIVVDPVVRSTSGFELIDDVALGAVIERLFPLADLITPNIPEAEIVSKMRIDSAETVAKAAEIMRSLGAKNILIKGGHLTNAESRVKSATDYLFTGEDMHAFEGEFIATKATRGTGCMLASAIAANLALGKDLVESVKVAKDFVMKAILTGAATVISPV